MSVPLATAFDEADKAVTLLRTAEQVAARVAANRTRIAALAEENVRLLTEVRSDLDQLERLRRDIDAAQAAAQAALDQVEAAQRS